MDAIWPAEFAKAKLVVDITAKIPADFKSDVFESALAGAAYQGKFYGVPWINDTKFLFYNKKMLADAGISAPPTTWDEVRHAGQGDQGQGHRRIPARLELGAGRSRDLRLDAAGRR